MVVELGEEEGRVLRSASGYRARGEGHGGGDRRKGGPICAGSPVRAVAEAQRAL